MKVNDRISIIIPVINERENVVNLLSEFDKLVSEFGLNVLDEVVFVDDGSSDGTVETIKEQARVINRKYKINIVERHKKMGQVDACIIGSRVANNDTIVIMDADLQHPPKTLIAMSSNRIDDIDIVAASRHVRGGGNIWSPTRGVISRVAILMAQMLIKPARRLKDPTTGYFMTSRDNISDLRPLAKRTKLMLYLLSMRPELKVKEVAYTFVDRTTGRSKTITRGPSFIVNYIIEVLGYMKLCAKSRFTINNSHNKRLAQRSSFRER